MINEYREFMGALGQGHIQMIKALRTLDPSLGLTEAKKEVDSFVNDFQGTIGRIRSYWSEKYDEVVRRRREADREALWDAVNRYNDKHKEQVYLAGFKV